MRHRFRLVATTWSGRLGAHQHRHIHGVDRGAGDRAALRAQRRPIRQRLLPLPDGGRGQCAPLHRRERVNYPAMLIENPVGSLQHAITIRRARHEVWPWLVQMGAGSRAGWYSYDFLDNGRQPSATRIIPELQQLAVGMIFSRRGQASPTASRCSNRSAFSFSAGRPRRWTSHDVGVRARRGCAIRPSHRACSA